MNDVLTCVKMLLPITIGCVVFRLAFKYMLHIMLDDTYFYGKGAHPDFGKGTNSDIGKSEVKEPDNFDIPEKQKDFIQLN